MTPAPPLVRSGPGGRPLATQDEPFVSDDKRRAPRVKLAKGTRAQIKSTLPVELLNLSATGVLMELPTPLRPGSTCDLSATLSGIVFTALVRVTRCRAGGFAADESGGRILLYVAGGEFVGLSDRQLESLARAIEAIGGAKLAGQSSAYLKRARPA
ncbi:MAG: PilZ domain-containing protein [Thermoanaerobaculia bacterium]